MVSYRLLLVALRTRMIVAGGALLLVAAGAGVVMARRGAETMAVAARPSLPTAASSSAGPSRAPSAPAQPSASPSRAAAVNPYSRGAVPADPAADPGPDPVFAQDDDLRRTETYTYRFSRPGDHRLAAGTYAFQYDVTTHALKAQLAARRSKLAAATGIALYLTGGTALTSADLAALQGVHRDLGLTNLTRLYAYNLRTIEGGRECTPNSGLACAGQTARGGLFPYLWFNGWWDTWVKHLVLDDLAAIPDGAFSNHTFAEVSMRSAVSAGVMAFGHGPRAKWSVLYLPSMRTIAHDAFRRNQGLRKVVLPRATTVDDYAFDDATSLRYFNAPQLERLGRNALNDSGELLSVNFPKVRYLGINSLNGLATGLRLPALTEVDKSAVSHLANLRWVYAPRLDRAWHDAITDNPRLAVVYLPRVTRLGPRALRGNPALTRIFLGERPPRQEEDVFAGTGRARILHTGGAAAWAGFVPAGNPSLPVGRA